MTDTVMFDVTPVIERLRTQLVPATLASVGEFDDINDAIEQLKSNKLCAFVGFTGEGGGEGRGGTGVTMQKITYRFLVLLGIQGAGIKNMAKGRDMETARDLVKHKLMGWMPAGAETPIVLVSSRVYLKDLERSLLFFGSEFQTTYHVRKAEVQ